MHTEIAYDYSGIYNIYRDGTCSARTYTEVVCAVENTEIALEHTHRDGVCSTRTGSMCTETHSPALAGCVWCSLLVSAGQ